MLRHSEPRDLDQSSKDHAQQEDRVGVAGCRGCGEGVSVESQGFLELMGVGKYDHGGEGACGLAASEGEEMELAASEVGAESAVGSGELLWKQGGLVGCGWMNLILCHLSEHW